MQNGKGRKLNYFCRNETNSIISETRNGRKKAVITYYLDTSPTMMPKSDEHQYCSKNAIAPMATNFTLSNQGLYKLGGDSAIYTSKSDGFSFCHCSNVRETTKVFKLGFYGFIRRLITHERKRNLL